MAEFTEDELAADAVTAETIEQPAEQSQQDRARDEAGRFAAAENGEQQEPAERGNGKVPHQALHQEREGHKQTKAQLAEAQATLRQLAELRQRITQAQPQEEAPPADDPAANEYLRKQLGELSQRVNQRDQRDSEQAVTQQENQLLFGQLNQSENEFRATTPDYDQAAQYLAQARSRELARYGLQQHEIHAALADEVLEITRSAINMGKNPAQLAYEIAQDRGYQPGAQQGGQQGEHPMLAAIAKGQAQRSFGNGRAAAGAVDPNANTIANMNEAEFARAYNSDPQFRALADRLG